MILGFDNQDASPAGYKSKYNGVNASNPLVSAGKIAVIYWRSFFGIESFQ